MEKSFIAITALIGTIIGAGILGLPYAIQKTGFFPGIVIMLCIAVMIILSKLYLGEITLRTKTNHQLSGYAEKYLGKKGKYLMFYSLAFGIYSALLAYLIGESESLSYLIFGSSQYAFYCGVAFWLLMSIFVYSGISSLRKGEPIGVILTIITVISIAVFTANKINLANLSYMNWNNIFAPFGVILFAFLGFSAIPEVKRLLGKNTSKMKKVILTATITAFVIYAVFTAAVLGFKGSETPEIATLALGIPFVVLGMITMFTAYLALSVAFMDNLIYDFRKSKPIAWLYTIGIPIFLFAILSFLKLTDFIKIIGIGGVISGGVTAILILAMIKRAKLKGARKPEYSIYYARWIEVILTALFVLGIIWEIVYLIL